MTSLAVEASEISKAFAIPHEQRTTFKEYFLHPFRRTAFERNQALNDVSVTVPESKGPAIDTE